MPLGGDDADDSMCFVGDEGKVSERGVEGKRRRESEGEDVCDSTKGEECSGGWC